MLWNIISVIANVAYYMIMNTSFYVDRAMMPNGQYREWRRSPLSRLEIGDRAGVAYVQLAFAAVSVVTSILLLIGVKNDVIKKIQLFSTIGSTVLFIAVIIVSANTFVDY